jgi:hypothetical protein
MLRRERAKAFRQWLVDRPGFVLSSWGHHLTGVSKAAITKAVRQGRVRVERFTFPDGHTLSLVSLSDVCRLDVYTRRGGWAEDADDVAPPSLRRGPDTPRRPDAPARR